MTSALLWDGLAIPVPDGMEPAVLDSGYVRLAGSAQHIDLRFGPDNGRFDPVRDGKRLTRAAGLPPTPLTVLPLSPLPPETTCYHHDRLYVLHQRQTGGIVAVLFATPPQADLLHSVLTAAVWNRPDQWRAWHCYDLQFDTPPEATLTRAAFRPGHFHLEFTRGKTIWTFDRLLPASILLQETSLQDWASVFLSRHKNLSFSQHQDQLTFLRPLSGTRRLLSLLAHTHPELYGFCRHDRTRNRLLLFIQQGRPLPRTDYDRMATAYGYATLPH